MYNTYAYGSFMLPDLKVMQVFVWLENKDTNNQTDTLPFRFCCMFAQIEAKWVYSIWIWRFCFLGAVAKPTQKETQKPQSFDDTPLVFDENTIVAVVVENKHQTKTENEHLN